MIQWILIIVVAVGCAQAGIIQAPSEVLRNLHTLMNAEELGHIFGVNHSSGVEEYEVIYIRHHRPSQKRSELDDSHVHYSLATNRKEYNLKLRPNNFLVAPKMKTVVKNDMQLGQVHEVQQRPKECHFLHVDSDLVAALSHCTEEDIHGYLIDGGKSSEIRPLSSRLRKMLQSSPPTSDEDGIVNFGAHILRAVDPMPDFKAHAENCEAGRPSIPKPPVEAIVEPAKAAAGKASQGSKNAIDPKTLTKAAPNKILELSIYVDEAATSMFLGFYGKGEYVKLREFVLGFVNAMQALYHLPSLGQRLDLAIVYMEFHAKNPATMPNYNGDRSKLLDSFCGYQKGLNKPSDDHAEHWDMALLLSGLDFYAVEGGKNNYATMGLSSVTGVCTNIRNCVIGEIGVVNKNGQPYPSTGFTSVYVMAHEIGHNLGMSHDSSGNTCPTEGFIMSPSRGVVGETTWSSCSANVLATINVTCMNDLPTGNFPDYNHNKYGDNPGQMWSADDQCRILLRDRAAQAYFPGASDLANACDSMKCKTPNRDGYFISGPALPGTVCGQSKWCQGGQCVAMTK